MDSPSSSSQPGPPRTIEASLQDLATEEIKPCYICYCHSFDKLGDPLHQSEHSWDAFVTSAQNCSCCSVIVRGCRGWLDHDGKQDRIPDRLTLFFKSMFPGLFTHFRRVPCFRYIVIVYAKTSIKLEMLAKKSISTDPTLLLPKPWSFKESGRTGFTGSEKASEIAKSWLKDCVVNHVNCPDNRGQNLPTRLLDLELPNNAIDLRLVEMTGKSGCYAALSHCWGARQQYETTTATLQERKECILFRQLTKTFKEAIQVTRALRIRYLWIDSLCIVQGDQDDWAREASRMSSVYQNAQITIAAAASDCGDKGLFRRSFEYEVETHSTEGESRSFVFRTLRPHIDEYMGQQSTFPLSGRAWAFQERFLSPRVLHYTPLELFFECIQEARCECNLFRYDMWKQKTGKPRSYPNSSEKMSSEEHCEMWRGIAAQYSGLQLTRPSDKLVAIGGLARRFAEADNDYLAGLWSKSLVQDLQWISYSQAINGGHEWRAPSWSWAAIDVTDSGPPVITWFQRKSFEHIHVLGYNIVPKGPDVYGELLSGSIRLLGRCTAVKWSKGPGSSEVNSEVCFPNMHKCRVYLDARFTRQSLQEIGANWVETVCLLLAGDAGWSMRTRVFCLILKRLEPKINVFERVGACIGRFEDGASLLESIPADKTIVEIV